MSNGLTNNTLIAYTVYRTQLPQEITVRPDI